jgi:hypothetical protein
MPSGIVYAYSAIGREIESGQGLDWQLKKLSSELAPRLRDQWYDLNNIFAKIFFVYSKYCWFMPTKSIIIGIDFQEKCNFLAKIGENTPPPKKN